MKKIVLFSLITASFLGIIKIFSITPFNRLAADDFSYAVVAKNIGFWQSQWYWYYHWTGRFVSTFLQIFFTDTTGNSGKIFIYSLFTFGLLLTALIVFFERLIKEGYKNIPVYILASVSFIVLYFLTPNKTESWYWLTGSVTYLWPIIFFVFAASFIFKSKHSIYDYLIACLLVFLSVGGNETFGFLAVIVLAWVVIKKFNYFALSILISSVLSFAVVFAAPGNALRAGGAEGVPMNIIGSFLYSIQEGPQHLYSIVSGNLYYLLPMGILFAFLFSKFNIKENLDKYLLSIFEFIAIPVILSIFYMLPAFKSFGRIPPDRNDIALAFVILMSLIGISFYLGQIISLKNLEKYLAYKFIIMAAAAMLFIVSFSFVKTLASDFYIAKNYSQAYDAMITQFKILSATGDKKDVTVSLPEAGLITVTLDPVGHVWYKNQALSDFYGIGRIITK